MTDSERIIAVIDYSKMNVKKLSEYLDLRSPQLIYDIKRGKSGISKSIAIKISSKFPDISYEWLLTGNGEMEKKLEVPEQKNIEKDGEIVIPKSVHDMIIKQMDIIASQERTIQELRMEISRLTEDKRERTKQPTG